MKKQDLTGYGSQELSLQVFNDECLYNIRHRSYLKDKVDEMFIYTDEQWNELAQDLQDDLLDGTDKGL